MKKFLSTLLAALMLLTILAVPVSAEGAIEFELVAGSYVHGQDETLNVELRVKNNTGISAATFYIALPESLTPAGPEDWSGCAEIGKDFLGAMAASGNSSVLMGGRTLSVGFMSLMNFTADGTIFNIKFKVNPEAKITDDFDLKLEINEVKTPEATYKGTDSDKVAVTEPSVTPEITCTHPDIEKVDGKEATCTEPGYSAGEKCKFCGEPIGDTQQIPALGHDWKLKEHKEEATCTKEGIDVYECSRCGKTEERATEKAPHVESEDYKSDGESHWHYCVNCDAVIGDKEAHKGGTANCTEQAKCSVCGTAYGELDKTAHKWNDGVVTKEATCMVDGVKTYTCTLCGDTKTEAIKALGHDYDDGKITTPATCLKDGVKTYTCKRNCGQEGATKTEAVKATGHKPAAGYKSDATNHWQICENENCDAEDHIINVTAHTYTAGEYEHDADGHWQVCTVCKTETEHEEHVKGDMTQDESGHWYKCASCDEKLEFDAHTKATLTAAVEPYKDDNGVKHDGSLAYWHCPDCGKYFLDDNGKKVGVFDDISSFTIKYQDDCDDLGHTLTVISSNALSHTYMCTRECGFFWTEAHIFNEYGFCSKCGYKIPGFEETKPEDNVQVDSPTEGTEQGGDTEGDEMNADDTDDTADAPAEAPAESEPAPAPAPAETNPETGLAMSVIPAILAAAALFIKRR